MRFTKSWLRSPFWLVVALALVLAWPVLRPGYALFWGTPYFQFIPWRWLALNLLRQGSFPWWNLYSGLGTPLFANYQTAVLYPPTWLLFLAGWLGGLEALAYAHGWVMVLHWLWAAWGMARFTREQGFLRHAAWFSGLVFAFSGYSVARAGIFPSMNTAMAWTPWVLWAATRLKTQPNLSNTLTTGCILALQLLAGHAQTAWYTLLLTGAWWLLGPTSRPRSPRASKPTPSPLSRRAPWLAGLAAGLLALLLAGGQLAATAQYTWVSQRSRGLPEAFALQYSFWPWHFLNFLHPRMFGHPSTGNVWGYGAAWEDAVYIGVLPLLLALWAGVVRFRHNRFWVFAALVATLFALGWFTPLYPWLFRHVPTFNAFQAPTRWHLVTTVALAYLAGDGLWHIRRPRSRALYWTRLAVAAALGTGVTAWALALGLPHHSQRATLAPAVGTFGLLAFGSGWLYLRFAPRSPEQARTSWFWVALAWTTLDLALLQQGWLPAVKVDVYTQNLKRPALLETPQRTWIPLQDAHDLLYRDFLAFTTFTPPRPLSHARVIRLPNAHLLDGLPSANAFDPLLPGRYVTLMETLEGLSPTARARWLARMGVARVLHRDPQAPYGVRVEALQAQPLLQWYPEALWVSTASQALTSLQQRAEHGGQQWDGSIVLLPGPFPKAPKPPSLGPSTARSNRLLLRGYQYADGSWDIEIHAPRAGYLLVAQNFYPGWEVRIDGRPAPVYAGEYAFLAFPVPAGRHHLTLRYRPRPLILALSVQGLAWIAVLGAGLVLKSQRTAKRRSRPIIPPGESPGPRHDAAGPARPGPGPAGPHPGPE